MCYVWKYILFLSHRVNSGGVVITETLNFFKILLATFTQGCSMWIMYIKDKVNKIIYTKKMQKIRKTFLF